MLNDIENLYLMCIVHSYPEGAQFIVKYHR